VYFADVKQKKNIYIYTYIYFYTHIYIYNNILRINKIYNIKNDYLLKQGGERTDGNRRGNWCANC